MLILQKSTIFVVLLMFGLGVSVSAKGFDTKSYNEALKAYKSGDYSNSYELFKNLNFIYLDDVNTNYYLGRSAFKLKKYEDAISAYDRILIKLPNNIRARLELARSYFQIGNFNDSKNEFEKILTFQISPKLKKNIEVFLQKIDDAKQRHFLSGVVMFGLNYDSNLHSAPNEKIYSIVTGVANDTTIDDSDWAHQEVAVLNHLYDFGDRGGYALKNTLLAMNKTLFEYSEKNIGFFSFSPALYYKSSNYALTLPIIYDRLWYGSDLYMYSMAVNPNIEYKITPRLFMNSGVKFQKKLYQASDKLNNSANYSEINTGLTYLLSDNIKLKTSAYVGNERSIKGSLATVDFDKYGLNVGLVYKLSQKIDVGTNVEYTNIEYKDIDIAFATKRADKTFNLGINTSYLLSNKYLLKFAVNYTNNDSNQAPNDYDKYTFGLNIIRPF